MIAFIDDHRDAYGVEPICRVLPIAPTIVDCSNRSATSRLPKPKINIMLPQTTSIWQRDSQPNVSGRPGAVHSSNQAKFVVYGFRPSLQFADILNANPAIF